MRALITFLLLLLAVSGQAAIFSPGIKATNAPFAGAVLHSNGTNHYWATPSASATNALNTADTTQFETNGQGKVTFKLAAAVTNLTRYWGPSAPYTNREPTWSGGSHVPPGVGLYHDGVSILDLRLSRGPDADGAHTNILYIGGPGAGSGATPVSNQLFEAQFLMVSPEGREAYLPAITYNWADSEFWRFIPTGLTNRNGTTYIINDEGDLFLGDTRWTNTLRGVRLELSSSDTYNLGSLTVDGNFTNTVGASYLNTIITESDVTVGGNFLLGGRMEQFEQAAPGTPPSGSFYTYPKTDGKFYGMNDSGTEYDLTAGAGGGEANEGGHAGVTNSTKIGTFHSKQGVTNFSRSVQGGNGITVTNEGTNIVFALTSSTTTAILNTNQIMAPYEGGGALWIDVGLAITNGLHRFTLADLGTGGSTNIYVTNSPIGSRLKLELFVPIGVTVGFPQCGVTNYIGPSAGVITSPASNCWTEIEFTHPIASATNISVQTATYDAAPSALDLTFGSNDVTRLITMSFTRSSASDLGLAASAATFSSTGIAFEGSTADGVELRLVAADPTSSDKTITLPNATGTIVLKDTTDTLTEKTFDVAGSGNVFKATNYIILRGFDNVTGAIPANTNDVTLSTFMQPLFSNSADEAANFIEWRIPVPPDYDTSVDPRAQVGIKLSNTDTAAHRYVLSMVTVAASGAYAGTVGTAINVDMTADGSGASGDYEVAPTATTWTTLTGWGAGVTLNRLWVIRLARDGNNGTEDASTVDSYFNHVMIQYGSIQ